MAFFDKLGDIARNIGDKTTEAIETTKLNGKISGEKAAIAECMRCIGEYYYGKYTTDGHTEPETVEILTAIDGHAQAIAAAQAEIDKIKAASAAQSAQNAPAANASVPPVSATGEILCQSCGKANAPGTRFCCECGAKLEAPAPASSKCPVCGQENPPGTRFCPGCGTKLDA